MFIALIFAEPIVRIDPEKRVFVTEDGRQIMFHGVNAVKKEFPFFPVTDGIRDYNTTIVDADVEFMKRNGFNLVRLGVMWPGVYPQKDQVNTTYLDVAEALINKLGAAGIYTLVDLHQDLMSSFFCGEGIPDWALPYEREGVAAFPLPVMDAPYQRDEETHKIDKATCLQKSFANYYNSDAVGDLIECLFTADCNPFAPRDGSGEPAQELILRDELNKFWAAVAERFKDNKYVVGYDLINEPTTGNKVLHPEYARNTTLFDEKVLQPFYQSLMSTIYAIDKEHVFFFEPTITAFRKPGFDVNGPGASLGIPPEKQSFAYHMYCMTIDDNGDPQMPEGLCKVVDETWYDMREKYAADMQMTPIINEFGALPNTDETKGTLQHELSIMSRNARSWAYWAFKTFGDITTAFDEVEGLNEGLFNEDMSVQKQKVKSLSHPYPRYTAGVLSKAYFDFATEELQLEFVTGAVDGVTEVFIGELWKAFGHGAKVMIGGDAISLLRGQDSFLITNKLAGKHVSVKIW